DPLWLPREADNHVVVIDAIDCHRHLDGGVAHWARRLPETADLEWRQQGGTGAKDQAAIVRKDLTGHSHRGGLGPDARRRVDGRIVSLQFHRNRIALSDSSPQFLCLSSLVTLPGAQPVAPCSQNGSRSAVGVQIWASKWLRWT